MTSAAPELARSMDKTAITGLLPCFWCHDSHSYTGAASSGLELDLQNECVYNDSGNICIRKEEVRWEIDVTQHDAMISGNNLGWSHWENFERRYCNDTDRCQFACIPLCLIAASKSYFLRCQSCFQDSIKLVWSVPQVGYGTFNSAIVKYFSECPSSPRLAPFLMLSE